MKTIKTKGAEGKNGIPLESTAAPGAREKFSDFRILLVEDNVINQKVASEMLGVAGFTVDIVGNGIRAVEAVKQKRYDAVLMDLQMPEMDGITATRAIRREFDLEALPIIAMTAHAMSGDREKCLEAGMNDYVPKPINRTALYSTLRKHIPGLRHLPAPRAKARPKTPKTDATPTRNLPGLDIEEALERLGGSWEVYENILKDFCLDQKGFAREFNILIEAKDFEGARILAHSLKGAAGNVSAVDLHRAAKLLEDAWSRENETRIDQLLLEVEDALAQVVTSCSKMPLMSKLSQEDDRGLPARDSGPPDPSHLSQWFDQLEKDLSESNPVESETTLDRINSSLIHMIHRDMSKEISKLENHIKNYRFDDARNVLKGLIQKYENRENPESPEDTA